MDISGHSRISIDCKIVDIKENGTTRVLRKIQISRQIENLVQKIVITDITDNMDCCSLLKSSSHSNHNNIN